MEERFAQAGQQMLRHWDEGGMVDHPGCQHLFGVVRSAEEAEVEAGPARDPQLHLLQNGCEEGCGGVGGHLGQMNAQVLHARPLRREGDSCGRIWTNKVAQAPLAKTLTCRAADLSLSLCSGDPRWCSE